jgi:hypothetical protein
MSVIIQPGVNAVVIQPVLAAVIILSADVTVVAIPSELNAQMDLHEPIDAWFTLTLTGAM